MKSYSASLLLCFATHVISGQVIQQDSLALVAFYHATQGSSWTDNDNWLSSMPVDSWYGISVSDQRVDAIDLYGNNLTGSLPEEIGMLTGMRRLDVANNHVGGQLPESLGQLVQLQQLHIYVNTLQGSFPSSIMNCQGLKEILAYTNSMGGPFPEALLMITGLQRLELGSNSFTGHIPLGIGNLTQLRVLGLDQNNFSGIMPSLRNLTGMVEMHLRYNHLDGNIADILGYMPELYYLTLGGNNFTGFVSDTFFNPQRIQYLDVQENNFAGIGDFSSFSTAGVLDRFNVYGNVIPFEYLEPNRILSQFNYTPQQPLLDSVTVSLSPGDALTIQSGSAGEYTRYQWFHNGESIPGATEASYQISDFQTGAEGIYHCEMWNDSLPLLTLVRNPVLVQNLSTGIAQVNRISLQLYPNPASAELCIAGCDAPEEMVLTGVPGGYSTRILVRDNTIDISGLPAGMYTISAFRKGMFYCGAFVKAAE